MIKYVSAFIRGLRRGGIDNGIMPVYVYARPDLAVSGVQFEYGVVELVTGWYWYKSPVVEGQVQISQTQWFGPFTEGESIQRMHKGIELDQS